MSAFLFIAMHAKRLLAIREFGSPAIYIRAGEVRVYVVWVRTRFLVDQCSVSFVSGALAVRAEPISSVLLTLFKLSTCPFGTNDTVH